jgi:hypothetical protein
MTQTDGTTNERADESASGEQQPVAHSARTRGLLLTWIGIALPIVGVIALDRIAWEPIKKYGDLLRLLILLSGVGCGSIGLAMFAKASNRTRLWGLWGVVPVFGPVSALVLLAVKRWQDNHEDFVNSFERYVGIAMLAPLYVPLLAFAHALHIVAALKLYITWPYAALLLLLKPWRRHPSVREVARLAHTPVLWLSPLWMIAPPFLLYAYFGESDMPWLAIFLVLYLPVLLLFHSGIAHVCDAVRDEWLARG